MSAVATTSCLASILPPRAMWMAFRSGVLRGILVFSSSYIAKIGINTEKNNSQLYFSSFILTFLIKRRHFSKLLVYQNIQVSHVKKISSSFSLYLHDKRSMRKLSLFLFKKRSLASFFLIKNLNKYDLMIHIMCFIYIFASQKMYYD